MAISNVITGNLVTNAAYNSVQAAVRQLMIDCNSPSCTLTPETSSVVAANKWSELHSQLDQFSKHRTGAALTYSAVSTADKINSNYVNSEINYVNALVLSPEVTVSSQLTSSITTDTILESWNGTLTHTVLMSWKSTPAALGFFKLGGYLSASIDYVLPFSPIPADQSWAVLLAQVATGLAAAAKHYTLVEYQAAAQPAPYVTEYNGSSITVEYVRLSSSQIQISTTLVPADQVGSVNIDIYSSVFSWTPRGDRGGFAALPPQPQTTYTMTGNSVNDPAIVSRLLTVSGADSVFTWTALDLKFVDESGSSANVNSVSDAQDVILTNQGNHSISVTDIVFVSPDHITAVPEWSWGSGPAVTIPANSSVSFLLRYTGTYVGSSTSRFSVISDNDLGSVATFTSQQSAEPTFNFLVQPPTWTKMLDTTELIKQQFTITNATTDYTSYYATIAPALGFTVDSSSLLGPTIVFDPTNLANQVINATLTLTVNDETKSVPVSVSLNLPTRVNIGTWRSALGIVDSVVGFSYDTINGHKFLTIGVGHDSTAANWYNTAIPVASALSSGLWTNWGEVFVIPIEPGTSKITRDYYRKQTDFARVGSWSAQFSDQSMFTVITDDWGNLTLTPHSLIDPETTNRTLIALSHATYYYAEDFLRWSDLSGTPVGDGTQTERLIGFSSTGQARTTLVTYPGYY